MSVRCVPLDETMQICLDKLYCISDFNAMSRPVLKNLIKFATKENHFILDGQYRVCALSRNKK